jgi:putative spermidine/putrescine transport system permease protein
MNPGALALGAVAGLAFLLILGPIAVVLIVSFSPTDSFAFPPPGLSLRWFHEFFSQRKLWGSFLFSLELALLTALGASLVGTLAALALRRRRGAPAAFLQGLFLAPLVFPTIVLGLALLLFFRSLDLPNLAGLVTAHLLVATPYCFRSVLGALQSFDLAMEEAAQSLGAGPFRTFFLVVLPNVWPGVLTGGLFAFIVSFGELNTALFLTSPGYTTLPIEILGYLSFPGNQLVIAAASTLQVGLIVLLVLAIERIVGIGRIVRGR